MINQSLSRKSFVVAIVWVIVVMVAQAGLLAYRSENDLGGVFNSNFRWSGLVSAYGLWLDAGWFLLALVGIHFAFAFACRAAFRSCFEGSRYYRISIFIAYLLMATLAALLLNSWIYPLSKAGFLLSLALVNSPAQYVMHLLVGVVFLSWLFALVKGIVSSNVVRLVSVFTLGVVIFWQWKATLGGPLDSNGRPNIIVLGVDSMRPDVLGGSGLGLTPHIDGVLEEAVVFDNALTTLGRTFPAMMTMLTGQFPINHGARDNLYPLDLVRADESIAWVMNGAGYQTTIFTDETRFSNIDQNYGFDTTVVPGYGLMDFAMSAVSDWFLLNLVSNTVIGRALFPYCYGNRAVEHLYDPASFNSRIAHALHDLDPSRPAYLHFHLETLHWPYRAPSPYEGDRFPGLATGPWSSMNAGYFRALDQADRQFGSIMEMLEEKGLLKNAIVVVVSDHGEGFVLAKDGLTSAYGVPGSLDSYGHGTNATSLPQNRVVFGWRRYGSVGWASRHSKAPVSLIDMAPTLAELAGVAMPGRMDGQSLSGELDGSAAIDGSRARFVESGLWPAGLQTSAIDPAKVLAQGATYYQSSSSARVVFREDRMGDALAAKQRAVFMGNWMLANEVANPSRYIVARFDEVNPPGTWWTEDALPPDAPVRELVHLFCEHWAADGDAVSLPACRAAR